MFRAIARCPVRSPVSAPLRMHLGVMHGAASLTSHVNTSDPEETIPDPSMQYACENVAQSVEQLSH